MKKVVIEVKKEVKVDGRTNNTGRPISPKSARQARLAKQAFYADVHNKFVSGQKFKIKNNTYKYRAGENGALGCIVGAEFGIHECNVSYIGRTKVQGFTYVLGKKVNIELNLKTLKFVK